MTTTPYASVDMPVTYEDSKMNEEKLYHLLGQTLRTCRETHQPSYTQDQLAKKVGLERSSISNIENGQQRVSIHTLYSLCIALNVQPQDVLPMLSSVQDDTNSPEGQPPALAAEALNKIIGT